MNMWHKVEEGDLPPIYEQVIGVWKEQSRFCSRTRENQWIDIFHNCYTYTAPTLWTENPLEKTP